MPPAFFLPVEEQIRSVIRHYRHEPRGPHCWPAADHRRALARRRGHAQAHGPGTAGLAARARSRQRGVAAPARPAAAPPVRAARRTLRSQPTPAVRRDGRGPGHGTQRRPNRQRRPSPSGGAGRTAAAACRRTCPASPGITSCPRPSASVRAAARCASTSARTRANSSTTGRRRCS